MPAITSLGIGSGVDINAMVEQLVAIESLGLAVPFRAGETIHTESSHKYSLDEIDALAQRAGFEVEARWLDEARRFSVQLLRPSDGAAA